MQVKYSQEEGLGLETGGGVLQALPLLGADPFILINGDIWTDFPLSRFNSNVEFGHLVLVPNPEFHAQGDYALEAGVLRAQGERFYFSGLSVLHPRAFANCAAGRFPLRDIFNPAIAAGQLSGELYQGRWLNCNTPEALNASS